MVRWILVIVAAYLATGFHRIPGNEQAVVLRCGRLTGPPRSAGLHYDLPWPWSRAVRFNHAELRSLSVGPADSGDRDSTTPSDAPFLPSGWKAEPLTLTGDRNLLAVRASVQYRIRPEAVSDFLFQHQHPEEQLRRLLEFELADHLGRCDVDYAQTHGLSELGQSLTIALRGHADQQRLGLHIERVLLDRVAPPNRVSAAFLDVSNARADQARQISEANQSLEQQLATATSDAEQLRVKSLQYQQTHVEEARGEAIRFAKVVHQLQEDSAGDSGRYSELRAITQSRLLLESLAALLPQVHQHVVLPTGETELWLGPQPGPR